MKLDQTFYVVKDTVTGEILTETKASGFARPALYASEASASRARGQRCGFMWVHNPDYDRQRSSDLATKIRNRTATTEDRAEYQKVVYAYRRVRTTPGRFVLVPVTLSEVINGKQ